MIEFDPLVERALAYTRGDGMASCCVDHQIPRHPITEVCSPKVAAWLLRERLEDGEAAKAENKRLAGALRDMEIALIEARLAPEHPTVSRRLALLDRLSLLTAEAEGGGE